MRQLVLVEDRVALPSADLAARAAAARLPDTPIVVWEAEGGEAAQGEPLPLGFSVEAFGGADVVAVTRHLLGAFPEAVDDDLRAVLMGADRVVACCPASAFARALRFYHPFLFALDGWSGRGQALDTTTYLAGLTAHFRGHGARLRHLGVLAPAQTQPAPPERPDQVAVVSNAAPGGWREQQMVLATIGDSVEDEAGRLGFYFNSQKVRRRAGRLTVRRDAPGIVFYGPYVSLEPGVYCFRVGIRGRAAADVCFLLEAAVEQGSRVLAADQYEFASLLGEGEAVLHFEVAEPGADRPIEFRLWNDPRSVEFDIRSMTLARMTS